MKKQAPYGEIFKLPGLLDSFVEVYSALLIQMQESIDEAIEEARKHVVAELEGKLCKNMFAKKFVDKFRELSEKAEKCNNVAAMQNIKVETDALKIRCLNEIAKGEERLIPKEEPLKLSVGPNGEGIDPQPPITPVPPVKVKKKKHQHQVHQHREHLAAGKPGRCETVSGGIRR